MALRMKSLPELAVDDITERRHGPDRRHTPRPEPDRRDMSADEFLELQAMAGYPFTSTNQAHLFRLRMIRDQAVRQLLACVK